MHRLVRNVQSARSCSTPDRASILDCHLHAAGGGQFDDPVVRRAIELIWEDSRDPITVSEIARLLPVTRRTLDRRFGEVTGHSVHEEINACRLSRAKRLLSETDLPVKTVVFLAGFPSRERMRVLFLAREGVSPTAFRNRTASRRPETCGSPGLE